MKNVTDHTPGELKAWAIEQGEGPVRGARLSRYLYQKHAVSFAEMTLLRASMREQLGSVFALPQLRTKKKETSQDGTQKFLFELSDGETIESVLIPNVGKKDGKRALCISTQVGCALACRFCLTGTMGLKRNLETWEIVEQYREVSRQSGKPITHLVFMGMGEPLHNFENLMRALEILTDREGAGFPETKITVSTAGLAPQLKTLALRTNVALALSLHAVDDVLRAKIMPVNKKYGVKALLDLVRSLPPKKQNRLFMEYILLKGVNDGLHHARDLATALDGLPCKINLIPYNELPGLPFERPDDEEMFAFLKVLKDRGFRVSLRFSRGRDISAACGQLATHGADQQAA